MNFIKKVINFFSSLKNVSSFSANPEEFFRKQKREKGDTFSLHLPGTGDIFFTSTGEGAKEILTSPPNLFEPPTSNPVTPLLGPNSLLLLSGERHQKERKLINPYFQGTMMQGYAKSIREITIEQSNILFSKSNKVILQDLTKEITLEVIIEIIFGVTDRGKHKPFKEKLIPFMHLFHPALMLLPFLRKEFGGIGPYGKFLKAKREVDLLLVEEINLKRKILEGAEDGMNLKSIDILSKLILTKEEGSDRPFYELPALLDELRTLLVAGHETTSSTLDWAIFYILKDRHLLQKLLKEIETIGENLEAIMEAPYLAAVCNEALRIHPVVPLVIRKLKRDTTFFHHHAVLEGQNVAIATTLLHTNEKVWQDPMKFNPERFLGPNQTHTAYDFVPFGGGHRKCLGSNFALFEMKIILHTLFKRYGERLVLGHHKDFHPGTGIKNITMGMKRPVSVVLA